MISLFATNPFYVLAIRATTDQRTLRRILEERGIQLDLGLNLLGGLSPELLRSFRQTIETPRRRVSAELFALHSVDPGPPSEQLAVLRERAQGASGLDRALLYHDVAVTAHLAWALHDAASPEGVEALTICLTAWRPVLREREFLEYLAGRSDGTASAEDLWRECVAAVGASVTEAAASLLAAKRLDPALAVINALRGSALPGDAIDRSLREITRETRGEIATAVQRIRSRVDGTIEDARLDEVLLVNEVLGPHRRLRLLGLPSVGADDLAAAIRAVSVRVYNRTEDPYVAVALLDAGLTAVDAPRLASAFAADRAAVLRLHHQERALTAWQTQRWAAAAAHATLAGDVSEQEEAESLRSMSTRSLAATSPSEVEISVRRAQAPFDAEREATLRRIDGAARFETWTGEARAYTNPAANALGSPSASGPQPAATGAAAPNQSQLGKWVLAIAAALVFLAWANGAFAGSSGARATNAPAVTAASTRVPQAPQQAAPTTARCVADLATMRASITSARARLTTMESDLSSLDQRMTSLKRSIQSTEATYPRGIPSSIYPSYSTQVDDYNRLLRQYKTQYDDYEALFTQTDVAIDRYNSLNATCR